MSRKSEDGAMRMSTIATVLDDSGDLLLKQISYEVNDELTDYLPLYNRAHWLMPEAEYPFITKDQYLDHLAPSIDIINTALKRESIKTEEIMRALVTLGHTVDTRAVRVLSTFSQSSHYLAPVAGLALQECLSLFLLVNQAVPEDIVRPSRSIGAAYAIAATACPV